MGESKCDWERQARLLIKNVGLFGKSGGRALARRWFTRRLVDFMIEYAAAFEGAERQRDEARKCAYTLSLFMASAVPFPAVETIPAEVLSELQRAIGYGAQPKHPAAVMVQTTNSAMAGNSPDEQLASVWVPEVMDVLRECRVDLRVVDSDNGPAFRMMARSVDLHQALMSLLGLPHLKLETADDALLALLGKQEACH